MGQREASQAKGNVITCRASNLHQPWIIVRSVETEKVGVKLQCVLMI